MLKQKYEKNYDRNSERIQNEIREKIIVNSSKFDLLDSVYTQFDGKIVLDVGGGPGELPIRLSKYKCFTVTIDFSSIAIHLGKLKARQFNTNSCDFIVADANNLPIKKDLIDVAILTDIIEHVKQPHRVILQANSALKNKGSLYVTAPHTFALDTIFMDELLRMAYAFRIKKELPTHLFSFTMNNLKSIIELCGFKILNADYFAATYFFVLIRGIPNRLRTNLLRTIFKKSCIALYATKQR